ncbi:MAG: low molecular weight phosphatase family protein [Alphaproteobacteria bacterium]
MPDFPSSVLFCCTSNALRSPMAEGLMKFLFGRHVFVQSVGLRRGALDGFMISVMDEIGVDVSGHTVRTFDDLEDGSFDLIVSLSPEAQHHAVEMTRTMASDVEFWNTFDPSLIEGSREVRFEAYRGVRDRLTERMKQRFEMPGALI